MQRRQPEFQARSGDQLIGWRTQVAQQRGAHGVWWPDVVRLRQAPGPGRASCASLMGVSNRSAARRCPSRRSNRRAYPACRAAFPPHARAAIGDEVRAMIGVMCATMSLSCFASGLSDTGRHPASTQWIRPKPPM